MGISPISSRKMVPLWASSNRPVLPFLDAPENAPGSYPKSSLSRRFSGRAAQFNATKGSALRLLSRWMLWAKSSFPVPVSPTISTLESYKKLLELADGDSSDVIKKCLRIIKETRHIVEYELWNKIVYFMTDYINGETVWG